jgi:tRNA(fMet)-specific endonuclease VapC
MNRPSFLPDTNAAVAYLNGDKTIEALLLSGDVFLSSIVLGELYFGAENSAHREQNITRVVAFANGRTLIGCDNLTAQLYGQIKRSLRIKGQPIPQNDTWIAAQANQHGFTLVTRDAHFQRVDGLTIATW